jgi:hypothetical protein
MPTRPRLSLMHLALWGAVLTAVLPPPARATLGEPEATVRAEVQQSQASIKSTERSTYRLYEMQLPSGTRLREFAAPDGTVFAVAWNGPAKPDLRQALGKYFDAYVGAARAGHSPRTPVQIREAGFAMEAGGHMRAYTGRAYLPQAVPPGTALEEIR